MSIESDLFSLRVGELTLEGRSRAGNETWIRIPELGIALDAGRGPDALIGVARILISHAHPDHFAGIPFLASQRALQNLEPATVWLPAESRDAAADLMRAHERLEQCRYPLELVGASPGDRFPLRRNLEARAHRAPHRIPALAWELVERRTKLRPEFRHLPGEVLAEMRVARPEILEERFISKLFYSGDADAGLFETAPAVFDSEIAVIECTYVLPEDRERAGRWGHLHVDEIFERADQFSAGTIVMMHFSLRNRVEDIHREISSRCPEVLRDRVRLALAEPWDRIS